MSVICRRAQESDRDALIALWQQAFQDAPADIERFLDTFDYERTAYVLTESDRICTMLFLLPAAIAVGSHRFSVGYIYAGATRFDARGKGFYRRLLDYVAQLARQEKTAALLLRPADDALCESYRRMGFTVPLYGNAHPLTNAYAGATASAAEYATKRRELLDGQAYVDWDDRTLGYALSWCNVNVDDTSLVLYDTETAWESLPATEQTETALLMPLTDDLKTTTPIWFGYGLE